MCAVRAAACIAALLSLAAAAPAQEPPPAPVTRLDTTELPAFQPGLWEYRRTTETAASESGKPQVSTLRKCGDPTADIQRKIAELTAKRCQFTPLQKQQNRYLTHWICPTPNGPLSFRDVVVATSATAYRDTSESRLAQQVTRATIEATRIGDCPIPGASGVPAHPNSTTTGRGR